MWTALAVSCAAGPDGPCANQERSPWSRWPAERDDLGGLVEPAGQLGSGRGKLVGAVVTGAAERRGYMRRAGCRVLVHVRRQAQELGSHFAVGQPGCLRTGIPERRNRQLKGLAGEQRHGARPDPGGDGIGPLNELPGLGEKSSGVMTGSCGSCRPASWRHRPAGQDYRRESSRRVRRLGLLSYPASARLAL
jgi:hypothetical protein